MNTTEKFLRRKEKRESDKKVFNAFRDAVENLEEHVKRGYKKEERNPIPTRLN